MKDAMQKLLFSTASVGLAMMFVGIALENGPIGFSSGFIALIAIGIYALREADL